MPIVRPSGGGRVEMETAAAAAVPMGINVAPIDDFVFFLWNIKSRGFKRVIQ